MNTALLLIDIQKEYFPGGRRELVAPLEAALKAYMLLQCFREHGGHHVHIQHVSTKPGAASFIPGDRNTDIHDAVAHFEGEPLVQKHYPNSFRGTNLLEILQGWGIDRVVVCGMMSHMCVDATARAAGDLGFQVIVAEDACTTMDLTYAGTHIPAEHVHKTIMAALTHYGQVMTAEQVLAHLAAEREAQPHDGA